MPWNKERVVGKIGLLLSKRQFCMLILKWFQSGKDVEGKKKKGKSQGKGRDLNPEMKEQLN